MVVGSTSDFLFPSMPVTDRKRKYLYRALSFVHQAYNATRLTVATQQTFFTS